MRGSRKNWDNYYFDMNILQNWMVVFFLFTVQKKHKQYKIRTKSTKQEQYNTKETQNCTKQVQKKSKEHKISTI